MCCPWFHLIIEFRVLLCPYYRVLFKMNVGAIALEEGGGGKSHPARVPEDTPDSI